jgi:hypothetical protein
MHSLEAECRELEAAGLIDRAKSAEFVALERGALFPVAEELRYCLYASVAAITTGIGLLVKANVARLDSVSLALVLALVAALCYASAIRTRRLGRERSLGGDYLLLLGALVFSADVGYIESQFHWLGTNWSWQLLGLALVHGVVAYLLDSRLVLSVALAALAGWFGVRANLGGVFYGESVLSESAAHALACATLVLLLRLAHPFVAPNRKFAPVYEHFAAHLAFWGTLALCFDAGTRAVGVALLIALATVSIRRGLKTVEESFVVYGVGYATLGLCVVQSALIGNALGAAILDLLTVVLAVSILWRLHHRLSGGEP